jgi:hypothetical protein
MDWCGPTCYAIQNIVLINDVIDQFGHLNIQQKKDQRQILGEHTKLFDGTQGDYPYRKFYIDLVPGAMSKHSIPYDISIIHLEAFRKELLHLLEIGILSPHGASEWVAPIFITPPKDGRVHWVSDLRELNKVVKRIQ